LILLLPLGRRVAASEPGILLQGRLDHVTLLCECGVPCRVPLRHPLGGLLAAVDSRLRKPLKFIRVAPPTSGSPTETELDLLADEIGSISYFATGSVVTSMRVPRSARPT
jgi:hypothetical protein